MQNDVKRLRDKFNAETASNLFFDVGVEVFCQDADTEKPFYQRERVPAYRGHRDDELRNHPVYLIRVDELVLFRIGISHREDLNIPELRLHQISFVLPDEGIADLPFHKIRQNDTRLDVLALIDPKKIPSEYIHTPSPSIGSVHQRYVKLQMRIVFQLEDELDSRRQTKTCDVYFQMLPHSRRLLYHKMKRFVKEKINMLPQSTRDRTRTSVRVTWKVAGLLK